MATCPNFALPYCQAHDYDHVLERQEQRAVAPTAHRAPTVRREAFHALSHGMIAGEASTVFGGGPVPEAFQVPNRDGTLRLFTWDYVQKDREGETTMFVFSASGGLVAQIWND